MCAYIIAVQPLQQLSRFLKTYGILYYPLHQTLYVPNVYLSRTLHTPFCFCFCFLLRSDAAQTPDQLEEMSLCLSIAVPMGSPVETSTSLCLHTSASVVHVCLYLYSPPDVVDYRKVKAQVKPLLPHDVSDSTGPPARSATKGALSFSHSPDWRRKNQTEYGH